MSDNGRSRRGNSRHDAGSRHHNTAQWGKESHDGQETILPQKAGRNNQALAALALFQALAEPFVFTLEGLQLTLQRFNPAVGALLVVPILLVGTAE